MAKMKIKLAMFCFIAGLAVYFIGWPIWHHQFKMIVDYWNTAK